MSRFALLLFAGISLVGLGADHPDKPATIAVKPNQIELLAFMADWCEPCQNMRPTLKTLERSGYSWGIIDVDQSMHLAERYNVTALPTLVAIAETGEIWRHVGATTEQDLRDELAKLRRNPEAPAPPAKMRTHANGGNNPNLPGAVKVERLLRVTYQLPKQRAQALLDFLQEHSEHDLEATIQLDQLILTASPTVHKAVSPFINTMLQKQ